MSDGVAGRTRFLPGKALRGLQLCLACCQLTAICTSGSAKYVTLHDPTISQFRRTRVSLKTGSDVLVSDCDCRKVRRVPPQMGKQPRGDEQLQKYERAHHDHNIGGCQRARIVHPRRAALETLASARPHGGDLHNLCRKIDPHRCLANVSCAALHGKHALSRNGRGRCCTKVRTLGPRTLA